MKKLFVLLLTAVLLCASPVLAERGAGTEGADIPDELLGQWHGVGTPKNGGLSINLTFTVNADGTGEYDFAQGSYHESYPFVISKDSSAFSVNIPSDNQLGIVRCEGTWTLENGALKLDITTTFASGGSYSYTADCEKTGGSANELTDVYAHAQPGESVRLAGETFELRLFTMTLDNGELIYASAGNPLPAQGEVYLLRFAVAGEGEPLTPETIEKEIAPAMCLYSKIDGVMSEIFQVVTPGEEATREFDILFYCELFYGLEDLELLCDGVLYPLSDLPRNGEKLHQPTAEERAVEALNELHKRALDESERSIDGAACDGNVIVARYTASGEDASPAQLLTASSNDEWDLPREYRAENYETARWAVIVYPTRTQVGWYTGTAGGPANRTITWLALFNLETGACYKERIATEDPPQTITVQTVNGIPMSSGASGKFRDEDAMRRLTERIRTVRIASVPEPTPVHTEDPASEPTEAPAETPIEENFAEELLDALGEEVYRATYDALLAGEVIQKGSKGETVKGVQETLAAFGKDITIDGSAGSRTIAALNAVQEIFGLEKSESLDAAGYAELLPRLLIIANPDEADALLMGRVDSGAYDYMRACAKVAQGKYASARVLFGECAWGNGEERAKACAQPWPRTGVLYENPEVRGSATELTVQFNTEADTAMLVKVYTEDGVLARTMFIGGTGKATCTLPAGVYVIKDGVGKNWYGEEEAFGERPEGKYEIMTFEDGSQTVELRKNYRTTITVNVLEDNPDAEGVGSDWESWSDF